MSGAHAAGPPQGAYDGCMMHAGIPAAMPAATPF